MNNSYKIAGVDITAGYRAVELMKAHVERTKTKGVLSPIGGFGGLFEPDLAGIKNPVLVSGTDGVGTKLKIAFAMDKHDTIGIDCVAMCANDIICSGAVPLFFLDYIACGKNVPEKIADIVKGVSDGCVEAGCALIGGETAEMPGFYESDEYDIAGFCVGIVDKNKIIDGSKVIQGDAIIAIPSSGIHSNGFSLVRKIIGVNEHNLNLHIDDLGKTLGQELLTPTKIYVKPLQALIKAGVVKAVSHITGGGFFENIPRMLRDGTRAVVDKKSVNILPIFNMISKLGSVEERDMFNTFNMGVGMCVVTDKGDADKAIDILNSMGENAYVMGEIKSGEKGVDIC